MGCDIHPYVEEKIDGEWHMVHAVNGAGRERDYDFFTHLCGVRSGSIDMDPAKSRGHEDWPEPKGLPEDASVVVKKFSDRWDCDGHSHSYETVREFVDKKLVLQRLRSSDGPGGLSYDWHTYKILDYEIHEHEDMDDFRVVFWFDN